MQPPNNPNPIRIAVVPFNPTMGDIATNCANILAVVADNHQQYDLFIFPECALSGYNLRDLFFYRPFITQCEAELSQLCNALQKYNVGVILGAPRMVKNTDEFVMSYPQISSNNILFIDNGTIIFERAKFNLPFDAVFDDVRNFAQPKKYGSICEWRGVRWGLCVCEEIWHDEVPETMAEAGAQCLVVINASPFDGQKYQTRLQLLAGQARHNNLAIIYGNMLGGCDDVIYDGGAMAVDGGAHLCAQQPQFADDILPIQLSIDSGDVNLSSPTIAPELSENQAIYSAMVLGLRDYCQKNGIKRVMLGLSGGVDSALSMVVAADALGAGAVQAIGLPSRFSSPESISDARQCAENMGVPFQIIDIEPIHRAMLQLCTQLGYDNHHGLAFENIQARIRGLILMTLSNLNGALLLTTGNKSEMAVGYSTLYGDSCGGYNVVKDLYKTKLYEICSHRNGLGAVIPQNILSKPPSAELRPGQTDQDSLPDYAHLDRVLAHIIEEYGAGEAPSQYKDIYNLLRKSEFKRLQSSPGVKISQRAFGIGWRMPTTHQFKG